MAFADGNIIIGTSVDVGGIDTGLANIKKSFRKIGKMVTLGMSISALTRLGKAAIEAASNLQEIQNVVDVAFEETAWKIEKFADISINMFGMSELAAKQTAGSFMAMGKSIGFTKEVASDMAVELTGLSGDFASFYNISQEYAKVALSAVYTGETETLKRYGIILTETNLQEYANTLGITQKVKAMNAQDKAMLRYMYVMKATNDMHHDFERTTNSWANTTRVLMERWNQLMVVLGQGLIEKFQPVVQVLSNIVQKLIEIISFLNMLAGITGEVEKTNEDFSDSYEDVGDSIEDASGKAKKALAPFDKLNNITSGSGSGNSGVTIEQLYKDFELTGYVMDMLAQAEEKLNNLGFILKDKLLKAYKKIENFKNKINEIFDDIKLGNWVGVGSDLGDFIEDVQGTIKDALDKIDWQGIGSKIGGFFERIIWSDALFGWVDVMTTAIEGVLDMAIAAIDKISVADLIEFGKRVGETAKKFLKWFKNMLKKVNWADIGKKIGSFISAIDWVGVLSEMVSVFWEAVKDAIVLGANLFDAAPIATAILTSLAFAKWSFKTIGATPLTLIADKFGKSVGQWVADNEEAISKMIRVASVISITLGVSLKAKVLNDIEAGEASAWDLKTRFEDLISSALISAGLAGLASSIGIASGGTAFVVALPITFLVSTIIDFIAEPSEEEKQQMRMNKIIEEVNNLDWIADLEGAIQSFNEKNSGLKKEIDLMQENFGYYEDLAKAWYEMSQNYDNLTAGEKVLVKQYGEELIAIFPEIADSVNEVSGAYEGAWTNLDKLIKKSEEYEKFQAISKFREQVYEDLVLLDKQRAEAQGEYDKMVELFNLYTNRDALMQDLYNVGNNTRAAFISYMREELGLEDASMESNLKAAEAGINRLVEAIKEGRDSFEFLYGYSNTASGRGEYSIKFSDLFGEDWEQITAIIRDVPVVTEKLKAYDEEINVARADVEYWNTAQKESAERVAELDEEYKNSTMADDFKTSADKMREAYNQIFSDNEILQRQFDATLIRVKNGIITNGKPIKVCMESLFNQVNNAFNGLYNGNIPADIQTMLDTVNTKIQNGEPDAYDAMLSLGEKLSEGIKSGYDKSMDFKSEMGFVATRVKSLISGFQSKINGNTTTIEKIGEDFAKKVIAGYDEATKTHSPSKVMAKRGEYFVEGLANGISDNANVAYESVKELVDGAVNLVNTSDFNIPVPELSVNTKFSSASFDIPDIARGVELPITPAFSGSNSATSVAGLNRADFVSLIKEALDGMEMKTSGEVTSDTNRIFSYVQEKATIYRKQTGRLAF